MIQIRALLLFISMLSGWSLLASDGEANSEESDSEASSEESNEVNYDSAGEERKLKEKRIDWAKIFGKKPNATVEDKILTYEQAESMAEELRKNTTLIKLSLSGNNTKSDGAKCLALALENNTTLTRLKFDGDTIGGEGMAHIAELLRKNSTLRQLAIIADEGKMVGSIGVQSLSQALCHNSTLTQLDLTVNGKTEEEAINSLSHMLEENHSLTALSLPCSGLTDQKIASIANALAKNTTLITLDVSTNDFKDVGALAKTLQENATLHTVHIHRTSVNIDGFMALAKSLTRNFTLTSLWKQEKAFEDADDSLLKDKDPTVAEEKETREQKIKTAKCVETIAQMLDQNIAYRAVLDNRPMRVNKAKSKVLEIYLCCQDIPEDALEILICSVILDQVAKEKGLLWEKLARKAKAKNVSASHGTTNDQ
ncbi:MAG TPA: hypothetical protein VEL47_04520 [Myxococcota bacterium]|nr:hypothetical protein [Myxococcota bacterium]